MEISLVDEDATIQVINNSKALSYTVKYNGKNLEEVPVFKNWLSIMKSEKGEFGIICYCVNCHLFFYFSNIQEKKSFFHNNNCYTCDYAVYCEHCGELFFDLSICCYKKGIDFLIMDIYKSFDDEVGAYFIFFPFIWLIFYFARCFNIIISIRKKRQNINYKTDYYIDYSNFSLFLFVILAILYSLIYSISFTILYFFHLIFLLKIRKQKIKDNENNYIRY